MDNIGEIIGIIIFLVISMLTSYLNKSKEKKPAPRQQAPEKKKQSPFDMLEKILFEQQQNQRPRVNMEPVIVEKTITPTPKTPQPVAEQKNTAYEKKQYRNNCSRKLREQLRDPKTIGHLILAHEILGKPKAFRD